MRVLGPPGWQSTVILKYALAPIESEKVFNYGGLGHLNGLQQLQRFQEAGLPCLEFTTDRTEAITWEREGIPTFGRKVNHAAATDLTRYLEAGWDRLDYWVKIIPVAREFRQHIFEGLAIRLGEWAPRTGTNVQRVITYPPERQAPPEVRVLAKAAVKACGYLFGGVDLLQGRDGRVVILEVNSAPAMDSWGTSEAYRKAITAWALRPEGEENGNEADRG